jgi:hypothetical protein
MSAENEILKTDPYTYPSRASQQWAAMWFEMLMDSGELDRADPVDRSIYATARKEVKAFYRQEVAL